MKPDSPTGETAMQAVKTQAWIETDGELHLKGLPCKKGTAVEVIILIPKQPTEEERQEALKGMKELADQMQFRSTGPYPSRDELHERH
jgi:hypothetical protein